MPVVPLKDVLDRAFKERYGVAAFSQFTGAQMMADKYGFSREALDAFALESHRRAAAATRTGAFQNEIVPLGEHVAVAS